MALSMELNIKNNLEYAHFKKSKVWRKRKHFLFKTLDALVHTINQIHNNIECTCASQRKPWISYFAKTSPAVRGSGGVFCPLHFPSGNRFPSGKSGIFLRNKHGIESVIALTKQKMCPNEV